MGEMMELLTTDILVKRLRYQGRQYESGDRARGASYSSPHYLVQAADTLESLQLEKQEYLQMEARNLNGDCICPAGYPGAHPKASHYPGCPIVLNQKIEQQQEDIAELADALKDFLIDSGWCDSYYDSLVEKHSTSDRCKGCNGIGRIGDDACSLCGGSGTASGSEG